MKASVARASLLSDGQLPRQRGEAETPTSNQSPRVKQGRRLLGPAALRTCPLASLLSQVRACLGTGGYCLHSGNGGPQIACLQRGAWLKQWPSTARLHRPKPKTLARGQASRGGQRKAFLGAASPGRLARRRRDQGKEYLARCS